MTAPAHESAAVLRMHRAGMHHTRICRLLDISKQQLIHEMNRAIDDETEAARLGQPIFDDAITAQVEAPEKNAKDVEKGEFLLGHNFVESVTVVPAHYDSLNRQQDAGHVIVKLIDGRHVTFAQFDKVRAYREPAKV